MNATSASDPALPPVVLYGSSGHASNIRDCVEWAGDNASRMRVVAYIDDFRGERGEDIDGAPIITFARYREAWLHAPVIMAVGDGRARLALADRIRDAGGQQALLNCRGPGIPPHLQMGEGCAIGPLNFIGGNCRLGRQVHVLTQTLLGHHIEVGDGATICSGAVVGGHVVIEDEAFLGLSCTIVNGTPSRPLVIGRGARVHAGAVVTKSVAPGETVVGNPARPLREFVRRQRRSLDSR